MRSPRIYTRCGAGKSLMRRYFSKLNRTNIIAQDPFEAHPSASSLEAVWHFFSTEGLTGVMPEGEPCTAFRASTYCLDWSILISLTPQMPDFGFIAKTSFPCFCGDADRRHQINPGGGTAEDSTFEEDFEKRLGSRNSLMKT